jgi:hypothetical protein
VSKGLSRSQIVVLVLGGVVIVALIVRSLLLDATPPSPIAQVVFQDDFASRANGWDDAGSTRAGGHYTNDAYRVFAEPTGKSTEGSAPRNAPKCVPVRPSQPPNRGRRQSFHGP